MDVTTPTPLTPSGNTPAPTVPAASTSVLASDFETFLKMLTAQAKYQDPLEPLDSSEYASQLAQFSMVEQQVQSNDLLTALAAQLGSSELAQMAGWVGMEARTSAPAFYDGTPLTLLPTPAPAADKGVLVVTDAYGGEVQRQDIPVSSEPISWTGLGQNGFPLASGNYSFAVESMSQGTVISTTPAQTYSQITEVRQDGADTMLILNGGTAVQSGDVTALRDPTAI